MPWLRSAIKTDIIVRQLELGQYDDATVSGMHPMARMGNPAEIARGIVWLLSDEASFVTGHILNIERRFSSQVSHDLHPPHPRSPWLRWSELKAAAPANPIVEVAIAILPFPSTADRAYPMLSETPYQLHHFRVNSLRAGDQSSRSPKRLLDWAELDWFDAGRGPAAKACFLSPLYDGEKNLVSTAQFFAIWRSVGELTVEQDAGLKLWQPPPGLNTTF